MCTALERAQPGREDPGPVARRVADDHAAPHHQRGAIMTDDTTGAAIVEAVGLRVTGDP
jgi:hypothetical protein